MNSSTNPVDIRPDHKVSPPSADTEDKVNGAWRDITLGDCATLVLETVPDYTLFSATDPIIGELLSKYITTNVESHALTAQRDALLPKLVSGAVRVEGNS